MHFFSNAGQSTGENTELRCEKEEEEEDIRYKIK